MIRSAANASISRTRSASAPFSINSISAILSSVIVVFLVRFSFANRTLREDRRWPPRGVRSYTTPRDVTIPGSPYAVLTSMPADLKAAIAKAFFDAPTKGKAAFDRLSDGKSPGFAPAKHSDYKVTEDLQKFVDSLRKKGS